MIDLFVILTQNRMRAAHSFLIYNHRFYSDSILRCGSKLLLYIITRNS